MKKGNTLTIGYMGGSRCQKGYHFLPDIIVGVSRYLPDAKLVIQSQIDEPSGGERNLSLERDAYERICCLEGIFSFCHIRRTLSQTEYDEVFGSFSLALLPYDPDTYRDQSSGVLSDALSMNVVPAVTRGTWLAEQLGTMPDELKLVADFSSESFMDLILRFARQPRQFQDGYSEFSRRWYARHNGVRLVDELLQLCVL